jgi:hypothetical protein
MEPSSSCFGLAIAWALSSPSAILEGEQLYLGSSPFSRMGKTSSSQGKRREENKNKTAQIRNGLYDILSNASKIEKRHNFEEQRTDSASFRWLRITLF